MPELEKPAKPLRPQVGSDMTKGPFWGVPDPAVRIPGPGQTASYIANSTHIASPTGISPTQSMPATGTTQTPTPPDYVDLTKDGWKLITKPGDQSAGLGYDRIITMPGSTWRDCSTVVIMPSRERFIHHRIAEAFYGMIAPMNQKRAMMFCYGDEVGVAYNRMINDILAHPELSKWKYVLTVETDNLVPQDAQIRLIESIERTGFDAMAGIYHTKGKEKQPMAYGDPDVYRATGVLEFAPRDVRTALIRNEVMEVNGVACGCTLYRMELFRQVPQPWFVTVADVVEGKGPVGFTQDLWFAKTCKQMGKRFGVDLRVRVGHMDLVDGTVY